MKARFGIVALECLCDLGVTIVYAVVAGLLIVAIVASDDGPIAILRTGLYAMALPIGALALVLGEIGLRLCMEWRAARRGATRRNDRMKSIRLG